jgi:hypothetical protein
MAWPKENVYGRTGAPIRNALYKAALAMDAKRLRAAAERVLESAAYGETWQERMAAISFLADRIEGKAQQSISLSGDAPKELQLGDLVAAVLAARSADATDTPTRTLPDPAADSALPPPTEPAPR